jgi:hypothetical protein
MNWFWLNVPLEVLFFVAWTGIPLWLVLRRPSWGSQPSDIRHRARPDEQAQPRAADIQEHQHASDSRPLADARR